MILNLPLYAFVVSVIVLYYSQYKMLSYLKKNGIEVERFFFQNPKTYLDYFKISQKDNSSNSFWFYCFITSVVISVVSVFLI